MCSNVLVNDIPRWLHLAEKASWRYPDFQGLGFFRLHTGHLSQHTQPALVSQRDNVINMTSRPRRCSDSISFLVFVVSVLVCGCQDVRTVWSAEARSPDGNSLASASMVAHYGPGTAGAESSVYQVPTYAVDSMGHRNTGSKSSNRSLKSYIRARARSGFKTHGKHCPV